VLAADDCLLWLWATSPIESATHMGWSIKHTTEVIERYVALSPAMTDALAAKLLSRP